MRKRELLAPSTSTTAPPRKLSEVLDEMAGEVVEEWAKERKHTLWLGGPSRKDVRADIAKKLREAYDLAKDKYKGP